MRLRFSQLNTFNRNSITQTLEVQLTSVADGKVHFDSKVFAWSESIFHVATGFTGGFRPKLTS